MNYDKTAGISPETRYHLSQSTFNAYLKQLNENRVVIIFSFQVLNAKLQEQLIKSNYIDNWTKYTS